MRLIAVFLLVYVACVAARRLEEMLDAGDELLRRAGGARRAFCLLDWTP